ncbi:MAG: Gfo/Idh/MocA family oxidoreductase [Anaerolineae bacterium]|nr:Gfo/Idh/MocA family oxidoreductase [Anaerolineae bacterium]
MKIGIMSFAHHHSDGYIQCLKNIPGLEICIADEDLSRAQQQAETHGVLLMRTYEELLASKPDGVIITSENNKHRGLVEMAAAQKINVLCEKPIATTLEDGKAMLDACNKAGVIFMTAFPMRFSPPVMEVKKHMDDGDYGKVLCFTSTNQGELPKKYRNWFVDKKLAGGGAIMDHTVHLADILRWYLQSEAVEVYASTNQIFYRNEVDPDIETGGVVSISFANGVFATIDCSWCRPMNWPTWGGLTFEMVTERGAVLVDAFKQNLTVYRKSMPHPTWSFWGSDSNMGMVKEFITAIKQNRAPLVTGLDGYKAVEIALAAYQSAQTGQPVKLSV